MIAGIELSEGRNLHPTAVRLILRALTAVGTVRWSFCGPEVRFHALRLDIRTCMVLQVFALSTS